MLQVSFAPQGCPWSPVGTERQHSIIDESLHVAGVPTACHDETQTRPPSQVLSDLQRSPEVPALAQQLASWLPCMQALAPSTKQASPELQAP